MGIPFVENNLAIRDLDGLQFIAPFYVKLGLLRFELEGVEAGWAEAPSITNLLIKYTEPAYGKS